VALPLDYHIQQLSSESSHILARVGPDVFDNPIDARQLRAFLDDERHILFVALDNEVVVGMASAVEYFHPDKQPQLWINEVGVASTHRRKGIGRRLVEELLNTAKERGCVFAWLGTDVDNKAAQACFGSVPDVEEPQSFLLYEWDLED
jgi:aminoglycoside 6'-N-acetyltransferase I